MRVLSHKNVNLHSASSEGGLVHIPAGTSKVVPDDVVDHPGFKILRKAGHIVKLADDESTVDLEDDAPKGKTADSGKSIEKDESSKDGKSDDKGKDNQQKPKADK